MKLRQNLQNSQNFGFLFLNSDNFVNSVKNN